MKYKELTDEQKAKFHICKYTEELTFPENYVWKVWFPLPWAMFKGMWLQYSSFEQAISEVCKFKNQEEIDEYIVAGFKDDGGW